MKLYPLARKPGQNRWCGPAAISFLTGLDTDQAAKLIRQYTGKRQVIGTDEDAMRYVLGQYGICMVEMDHYPDKAARPTLVQWLRLTRRERGQRTYLVSAGDHWQLISGRRYACGKVGGIVSLRDPGVSRRARVRQVWVLYDAATVPNPRCKSPADMGRQAAA